MRPTRRTKYSFRVFDMKGYSFKRDWPLRLTTALKQIMIHYIEEEPLLQRRKTGGPHAADDAVLS